MPLVFLCFTLEEVPPLAPHVVVPFFRLVLRHPLLCFHNPLYSDAYVRCLATRLGGSFRGITSLPLSWKARTCCGTWLGGLSESSPLWYCRIETKGSGFFLNPRLHCMTESAFSVGCARSTGTTHALLPSKMLREFFAGSGKAYTLSKNSMPRIIAKSSIGTIEKSSFRFHVPSVTCTPRVVPSNGLAGEFTALLVPLCCVTLRPRHLASSSEMKLCVAPVSMSARMVWPLMSTLTNMSPFFVSADSWLTSVLRRWSEPKLCWDSSAVGVCWPLNCAMRALSDFFSGQSRTQ